ncbi:aminopeptidase P family protein [Paraburkholderia sp. Cy-641]|uniref:M24 family metallopeptidase n=1 Tax=Paraburkholderia sp. Cy-641 TaxID=2608337 RepID=UPI0014228BA7|nr:Xaa-Pro peptidase family protein [Paraburkholderia sp. Cy-641]NIF78061.1 aminopeptidase P family protein [Paraburkholderia sp. Cy-641]
MSNSQSDVSALSGVTNPTRKIGPTISNRAQAEQAGLLNMLALGPDKETLGEWAAAGLMLPDLPAMRRYRLARVRQQLVNSDYAGILLYDPVNIRYATDSSNMQVWALHNACRYAFIPAEGPVILWEFDHCDFLSHHTESIDEIRPCVPWFHFCAGDRVHEQVTRWADEIAAVVRKHGGGNLRLAIDHCNPEGVVALERLGISVHNGEAPMEEARRIKCEDEIRAMRCAIHACEKGMEVMHRHLQPGITEQRLWSYLHAENIARGGEWIETRLLASGPRCNPWYQECSSRVIEDGDLVAFDTDLVGSYGFCVDTSRTWLCGDKTPTAAQREIYRLALEQVQHNIELLRPGLTHHDLTHRALRYPPEAFRHYSCLYHGVGLCDEAPYIYFPESWQSWGYDGVIEPGMVLCVESYLGRIEGGPGVKIEEQVLITKTGHEVLTRYPFEDRLSA